MTSEDFAKIFYSNFTPNIDWANIDEIAWMHQEGLFTVHQQVMASSAEFIKKIDYVLDPKNKFMKNGESEGHLALKSFAKDYLVEHYGISEKQITYEYPLIGFKVDVIDTTMHYPTECGDTNALKLEKYLFLPYTRKMLILPYSHSGDVKVFEFQANPRFFEYIKHKQDFLNQKNARFRK